MLAEFECLLPAELGGLVYPSGHRILRKFGHKFQVMCLRTQLGMGRKFVAKQRHSPSLSGIHSNLMSESQCILVNKGITLANIPRVGLQETLFYTLFRSFCLDGLLKPPVLSRFICAGPAPYRLIGKFQVVGKPRGDLHWAYMVRFLVLLQSSTARFLSRTVCHRRRLSPDL